MAGDNHNQRKEATIMLSYILTVTDRQTGRVEFTTSPISDLLIRLSAYKALSGTFDNQFTRVIVWARHPNTNGLSSDTDVTAGTATMLDGMQNLFAPVSK